MRVSTNWYLGTADAVYQNIYSIGSERSNYAFILSGEMAFAYFLGHMMKSGAPVLHPLNNGGTAAILFCFACLYLATSGPGPISVDEMRKKS